VTERVKPTGGYKRGSKGTSTSEKRNICKAKERARILQPGLGLKRKSYSMERKKADQKSKPQKEKSRWGGEKNGIVLNVF